MLQKKEILFLIVVGRQSFIFYQPVNLYNKEKNSELIKRLKQDDVAAFDIIYSLYCHRLHEFVLRYLKQKQDAEGVVQEVFIKVWTARSKIDENKPFESFLFTVAYNSTISLLRKRLSEKKSRNFLKSLQQDSKTNQILDEIQSKELNHIAQSLINRLSSRQKEIYLLSRVEGLAHKEIAKRLNISENTVKNHLVSALKYLKFHFGNLLITICLLLHHLFF